CTFHGRLSHVKNIQYLSGLENLRSLRVAIAETDDISFFESMKGLESLHLYRGRMYVPPCEYAMAESARLSAAGSDPISRRDYCDVFLPPPLLDITAIGNLTNLTDLWITGFTVKNIAALDNIEGLCTIHLIRSVLKDDTEVSSKELAWCSGQ
ncbi:MAG: hypothetical protein FWC36_01300, partial [Spirochaetes bacterium]|nr:hypothetical protein [Spirochaetota bacterium]